MQADGKIIVGGVTGTFQIDSDDQARRVRILPDGKILVAGFAVTVVSPTVSVVHFALARYNEDGSPDNGFGIGGKVDETPAASFALARGTAIQGDGKIIVAGCGAIDGVSAH
jgi:uncharacterized delta-60 repeat protein